MKTKAEQIAQHKKWIAQVKELYKQAAKQETPYDVANGSRAWCQADHTPGMDKLAEDWAILEMELEELEQELESEKKMNDNIPGNIIHMIPKDHQVIKAASKSIQIRIPVTTLDRIENAARRQNRSRSNMILIAIKFYLENKGE